MSESEPYENIPDTGKDRSDPPEKPAVTSSVRTQPPPDVPGPEDEEDDGEEKESNAKKP